MWKKGLQKKGHTRGKEKKSWGLWNVLSSALIVCCRIFMIFFQLSIWQIENIVRPFMLSDDDYKRIMDVMLDNFQRGLGKDTNARAVVKMFQTYVKSVPDGTGKHLCQ